MVPIVDKGIDDIKKGGSSSSSEELTFESVNIEEIDLSNFPIPDSLDEYIPEKWFPNIETILGGVFHKMKNQIKIVLIIFNYYIYLSMLILQRIINKRYSFKIWIRISRKN